MQATPRNDPRVLTYAARRVDTEGLNTELDSLMREDDPGTVGPDQSRL